MRIYFLFLAFVAAMLAGFVAPWQPSGAWGGTIIFTLIALILGIYVAADAVAGAIKESARTIARTIELKK